ncbi:MAG: DMT family transporter [Ferruginibacter sp.]
MNGLLFAFVAMISWSLSVFPFTKAGRIMNVASMNIIRLVLGTVLIFFTAFIIEQGKLFSIFSPAYLEAWLWLAISGILALGVGDYFGLRMYTILGPRFGAVLTTLSPAAALLMGFMLLGEKINIIGIAGICITIIGVMSISLGPAERSIIPDHGHGSVFNGIIFGIISAICNGAGLAFSKKAFITQQAKAAALSPISASFMRFSSATIIVLLFLLIFKKLSANIKTISHQPKKVLGLAITGTIFGPLLGVSFALMAIQTINVAVAQTIFALVPVVTLLISFFVLGQKISRYAILGAIIAISGVALLIWRMPIAAMLNMR